MEQENKALFRRAMHEFFVERDFNAPDRYYSPSYIQHNQQVAAQAQAQGISQVEGMKQFFKGFFVAFPDFTPTIEHIYAEGDKVFAFVTWRGTHKGEFMGAAPTGKEIVIRTAEIMRIEQGQFVEHWDVVDQMNMMQVLGLITVNKQPTTEKSSH
ncbi:MAG: ester cyclase [Mojavia pulchra JT2-VF2]|jgi:predicted ester cyclase|uniref:Ester cyclase n=1 Tax=Mojavia pulchra JT2-VF2 TaxID=287848 RepID=A0A951UGV8_9NOST|nr:ester cyclase [Mojavia pulchra JT2-VF2]